VKQLINLVEKVAGMDIDGDGQGAEVRASRS